MADKPIIFSGPMVAALLQGRKSQTRRVLKPQPHSVTESPVGQVMIWNNVAAMVHAHRLPYAPGDRLWVREAWAHDDPCDVQYRAGPHIADDALGVRWRSPIHMPRRFSRLTLTVTDVRVQRLQDITEADARAEGARPDRGGGGMSGMYSPLGADPWAYMRGFRDLWNSIHGIDAWDANPWVAALSFTVQRGNIDT